MSPSKVLAFALTASVLTLAAFVGAQTAGILTINGIAVPSEQIELLRVMRGAQPASARTETALKEELVRRTAIEAAAISTGFDKRPNIRAQLALQRQTTLIHEYLKDWLIRNPVTRTELRQAYNLAMDAQRDKTEYHLRHILVKTHAEARDIIEKIANGAHFDDLAKALSSDGKAQDNVELGWALLEDYVEPFAEAVAQLPVGATSSTPVKTKFGYHVILNMEVRPFAPPDFEQFAETEEARKLLRKLQRKKLTDYLDQLEKSAVITHAVITQISK